MLKKIIHCSITQIVIAIILINVTTFAARSITQLFLSSLPFSNTLFSSAIIFCVRMTVVYFVYYYFVKIIEKRKAHEIQFNKSSVNELLFGSLLAISCLFIVMMIIWLSGNYSFYSINSSAPLIEIFFYNTFFAFLQDIIYFAVIFRIIEKNYGSWIAITVASIIFGFKHLLFPGYTLWSVIAQTIEAGILLSSLYILYRKIWAVFGFHMAWNFLQYGFFQGFGSEGFTPFFDGEFSENIISGMPVGLEASVITFIIVTTFGIYYLFNVKKRDLLLSKY